MKVFYIYGSAGCGKTSYVFIKHGYDDVYRTTNYEFGWIDGAIQKHPGTLAENWGGINAPYYGGI